MKKLVCAAALAAVLAALLMCAAACDDTAIGRYSDRISDYRYGALRADNDLFLADVISGVREEPYLLDGSSAEGRTEYTLVTVRPYGDWQAGAESIPLTVTVGETEYELNLARHPFKGTYSAEIADALEGDELLALALIVGGESVTAEACVVGGVDGEYALTAALEEAADKMKEWKDYEIYLRVSENTINAAGGWYWYVGFLHDGGTHSVLINALSGEITAVRG